MFTIIDGKTLAKLHDKDGNFTVYEVPENCDQSYDSVLEQGTMVSYKKRGDVFRHPDGTRDTKGNHYNRMHAIDPKATRRSKKIVLGGKEYQMFTSPEGEYPVHYVEGEVSCHTCGSVIQMRRSISMMNGKPTRIQANMPVDKMAKPISNVRGGWHCAVCLGLAPKADAPAAHSENSEPAPNEQPAIGEAAEIANEQDIARLSAEPAAPEQPAAAEPEPKSDLIGDPIGDLQKHVAALTVMNQALGDQRDHLLAERASAPAAEPPQIDLLDLLDGIINDKERSNDFVRGATWAVVKLMRGGK